MSLIKVNKNENPYHIIGEYIEKHITCVDDIIAVISLDGNIINELFLVEITTESNFIWQIDWWEGEENVELIDFFFVSEACKANNNKNLIDRQQAIDALTEYGNGRVVYIGVEEAVRRVEQLPSAQPEIIYCKDCKHFVHEDIEEHTPYGFYNTYFHAFCDKHWDEEQGEYIDVNLDDFCSFAERREVTE